MEASTRRVDTRSRSDLRDLRIDRENVRGRTTGVVAVVVNRINAADGGNRVRSTTTGANTSASQIPHGAEEEGEEDPDNEGATTATTE